MEIQGKRSEYIGIWMENKLMPRKPTSSKVQFLSILFCCLFTLACFGTINIKPASEREKIPAPTFSISDPDTENQQASYSVVKVYELGNCEVPNCPLAWQLAVSHDASPTKLIYGSFPTFGAQTVIPAKNLIPGQRYLMTLGPSENRASTAEGRLIFEVNNDGIIEVIKE